MSGLPGVVKLGDAAQRVVENLRPARPGVETWPVTDRAAWLERRQKDVTASAIGAILNVHEHITAYELWALKSGLVAEDPEETHPMVRGRLLEPVAIELLRERRPYWKVWQPNAYWRDGEKRIGATPDALATDEAGRLGVVQVKTVEPSVFRRKWINDDHDVEPPLWIAIQALVEAHLTGAKWAAVAVMRVGFGLDIDVVVIPLHDGIMARIETEVAAFWRSIESGTPPDPDLRRDGALIEALYAPTGEVIDLSADNYAIALADERAIVSAQKTSAEKRLKEIKAELLVKLGDASAGTLADGRLIEAKRVRRAGYEVGPTEFVDLLIKKGKQAA